MALAVLLPEESDGTSLWFGVDIGRNRYFHYSIGEGEILRDGFPSIDPVTHQSALAGPLSPATLGRTRVQIPVSHFGPGAFHIQLTSFRELPDVGPAVSEVLKVSTSTKSSVNIRQGDHAGRARRLAAAHGLDQKLGQRKMAEVMQQSRPDRVPITIRLSGRRVGSEAIRPIDSLDDPMTSHLSRTIHSVPFSFREAHYSNAMFLQAIGALLSSALPVLNKVLGGAGGISSLLTGAGDILGGNKHPGVASNVSGATDRSMSPELAQHIAAVLQALASSSATESASSRNGSTGVPQSTSLDGYSQQMIAPALLAAIPMLAPLLEKVMNPETINAVLNNVGPKATIGAVADAVKDIGGLNIQAYQNILDHIQKNMPSSDTTPLLNHLLAVSASMSAKSILPSYRRLENVHLNYQPMPSAKLRGLDTIAFHREASHGLSFPLTIETPQQIPAAALYLIVKDAESLSVVAEKKWDIKDVRSGPVSLDIRLTPAETLNLVEGKDYLICSYLIWSNSRGERIGASRTMLIHVVGQYIYEGLDAGTDIVTLNDVEKFRPYWHKIWQESASREVRRWEWDCKYYYKIRSVSEPTNRIQTLTEESLRGGRRIEGRMLSGLELGLSDLNDLLPKISDYPQLNGAQLAALSTPAALAAFHRAARIKVHLNASEGDSLALWIYPEMRLQPIVLLKPDLPDANGLVRDFSEDIVHLPFPALCHFIGVTTAPI